MERRNFLKGLFAAGGASILSYPKRKIDEATALVQMATPEEMNLLKQEDKLAVLPKKLDTMGKIEALYKAMIDGADLYAQTAPGQFLSVGFVRSMTPMAPVDDWLTVDVTTTGAEFDQYVKGFVTHRREILFNLQP